MTVYIGRAEAARILGVTEPQVVALSKAGKLGPVRRGEGGGFTWDRRRVVEHALGLQPPRGLR